MQMAKFKPNTELYSHKVLSSVVDFLCAAGARHEEIRQIVEDRLAHLSKAALSGVNAKTGVRGDDTVSAAVLHRWHRDRKLLDDSVNPKPMRLFGRAPS